MRDGQDATPQPEPRWDIHGPRSGPCGFHLGIGIEITLAQQPEQVITDDPEVYDGTLLINGVEHHLTLIEVDETLGGDYQEATSGWGDRAQDALHVLDDGERPFRTIAIDGRTYVCTLAPYQR
jgi:hypothetical protein